MLSFFEPADSQPDSRGAARHRHCDGHRNRSRTGIAPRVYSPDDDRCLVENFFVIRSGFLQHKGSAGSGCTRIAGELSWRFGGHANRVELEAWNDCPRQSAEYIYRLGRKQSPPNVCIFAYSWGCGYGFVRLANELAARGIPVRCAVLCDPVYHGLARWRALLPRTLFRRIQVTVPANVDDVYWFRQHVDRPAGHDLRYASPWTRRRDPVVLEQPHAEIDNAIEFRLRCLAVARACVEGTL